jgi:ascorbate-specific PTS system EIIC-type component UlaA
MNLRRWHRRVLYTRALLLAGTTCVVQGAVLWAFGAVTWLPGVLTIVFGGILVGVAEWRYQELMRR